MLATRNVPQSERRRTPGTNLRKRGENTKMPMTVGKGKGPLFQTPAQSGKKLQPKSGAGTLLLSRALADKTPFANRVAPAPFETPNALDLNFTKPLFLRGDEESTVERIRPSSSRRHSRVPRSSSKSFETPANNGKHHWDIGHLQVSSPEAEAEKIEENIAEDDYDEIEYMPPNTLDLPYHPPFDYEMHDVKALAKGLRAFSSMEDTDEETTVDIPNMPDLSPFNVELELPELSDDDPFAPSPEPIPPKRLQHSRKPTPLGGRPASTRPFSRTTSASSVATRPARPQTVAAVRTAKPGLTTTARSQPQKAEPAKPAGAKVATASRAGAASKVGNPSRPVTTIRSAGSKTTTIPAPRAPSSAVKTSRALATSASKREPPARVVPSAAPKPQPAKAAGNSIRGTLASRALTARPVGRTAAGTKPAASKDGLLVAIPKTTVLDDDDFRFDV